MTKLVIVESPAKVQTIRKFLPDDFVVASSVGHIRDLPRGPEQLPKKYQDESWADYAVDIENGFEPVYVTIPGKQKVLRELKEKLSTAKELYLATDEDREGESISWHLVQALKPDIPVKRLTFNEITQTAIERALEDPGEIDTNLVEAQKARRILDRLYGYTLSPLLWSKITSGLSAGRVQSPAIRLVVMRERERRAFNSGAYWDLEALLAKHADTFEATLESLDETPIATGDDFDETTGQLYEDADVILLDQNDATQLKNRLEHATWHVADSTEKNRQSSPPAPFKTSTLQRAANGRLNLSPGQTMRIAQDLYEDGHITYMRTDSTRLSQEGLKGARTAIRNEYSPKLVPNTPRTYESDTNEDAQEAHEAIRPAGATFTPPDATGLTGRHKKLYDLIYRRTLASQMPNERYTSTTVLIDAQPRPTPDQPDVARFKATGKHVDFHGYRLAWPTRGTAPQLPELDTEDELALEALEAKSHETQPPKRYTEASLVEALEDEGIGRPSTYDSIITKIQDKGYIDKQGRSLVPTLTAFAVVGFLEDNFPELISLEFTAHMEDTLDEIATGDAQTEPYLEAFFLGEDGLQHQTEAKKQSIDAATAREVKFEDLDYTIKIGRYGPYIEHEHDGATIRANLPDDITPDELTNERIQKLLETEAQATPTLGTDPDTGLTIHLKSGPYGPYIQRGTNDEADGKPDRASLPDTLNPEDATLEDALWLLSLPRTLGEHPNGGTVKVGINRYGPYVLHEDANGDKTYEDIDTYQTLRSLTLDDALNQFQTQDRSTRKGVLRNLGTHPETGKEILLRKGRYGPYLTHDNTNASIPDPLDPETLTQDDALFLLSLPETLGEHPEGGTVLKAWGRYGPYIAHETDDGERTYRSLAGYTDLEDATLEDALYALDTPHTIGRHPTHPGTLNVKSDRDGLYLVHEADGDELRVARGLTVNQLRILDPETALKHLA